MLEFIEKLGELKGVLSSMKSCWNEVLRVQYGDNQQEDQEENESESSAAKFQDERDDDALSTTFIFM